MMCNYWTGKFAFCTNRVYSEETFHSTLHCGMFIHLKKNCKKFANALRLRKDTFKLKILDNCGFLRKQLLFLYYCPKIPLNAIVLHGREFDYNDNISPNSSTKKVVISRSPFSFRVKTSPADAGQCSDVSRAYFLAYVRRVTSIRNWTSSQI